MREVKRGFVRSNLVLIAVANAILLSAPAVRADDVSFVDTFRNIGYQQTGNGNTLTLTGTFFSAEINTTTSNPYTSASVSIPSGTSIALPQNTPTVYGFQTSFLPDQATMDALYGTGTYTFTGTNGATTDTATLNYTGDDYAQTLPYLTGTTYSDLQGMNTSQGFTFGVSTFTPGTNPLQSDALLFLSVFDETTGDLAFTQGFLNPSTTSVFMPGGTLLAGHNYDYEIDFSDRDSGTGTGGQFAPEIGFDVRTDGTFTTAGASPVPEPGSLMLLGTGLLTVAGRVIRRRTA